MNDVKKRLTDALNTQQSTAEERVEFLECTMREIIKPLNPRTLYYHGASVVCATDASRVPHQYAPKGAIALAFSQVRNKNIEPNIFSCSDSRQGEKTN